jgi:hypothetical protein
MNNDPDKLPDLSTPRHKDTGWVDLYYSGLLNTALFDNFDVTKYGRAEYRVINGQVFMRGLIKRLGGPNVTGGDLVMTLPMSMTPRTERRTYAESCAITIGDRTSGTPGVGYAFGQVKVDVIHFATIFLILDNVNYWID